MTWASSRRLSIAGWLCALAAQGCAPESVAPAPTETSPDGFGHPPDFRVGDRQAVFVRIARADVKLELDVARARGVVDAAMDVIVEDGHAGSPLFDVVPASARSVSVDGAPSVGLATVTSPDGLSTMRMVEADLDPGPHTLTFDTYELAPGAAPNHTDAEGVNFDDGTFAFRTDQDDTRKRMFTERYFPSGFEADLYPLALTVVVSGAPAGSSPDVMCNGDKVVSSGGDTFTITFDPKMSTSAWFVHVLDRRQFRFNEDTFASSDGRVVAVTTYAPSQAEADLGMSDAKGFLAELEPDYGPYPHARLLAGINTTRNEAEEYVGALTTEFHLDRATPVQRGSLGHEILHQWFGRSARPLQGRDGWVDEGIAQWRDRHYPREKAPDTGKDVPIAVASPYQRQTPNASYHQGSVMLANVDLLLANRGGLKPVLAAFRKQHEDALYTTEDFLAFLRAAAPDLASQMEPLFEAHIYAGAALPTP